ncbi:ribonuclease HI family protein [Nitrospira sp. Kam-Ns4a]
MELVQHTSQEEGSVDSCESSQLERLLAAASRKERAKAQRSAQAERLPLEAALERVLERASRAAKMPSFEQCVQHRIRTREAQRQAEERRRQAESQAWRGWFDGAAEPTNPGPRGIGALLMAPDGQRLEISRGIGFGTNNEAEYHALLAVLDAAAERGCRHLIVHGDSQLVINQLSGDWSVNSPTLWQLAQQARRLIQAIGTVELCWIPRKRNQEADRLSKVALGGRAHPIRLQDRHLWGNQTRIGQQLGLFAVAVGKRLDALGLRQDGRATEWARREGDARIVESETRGGAPGLGLPATQPEGSGNEGGSVANRLRTVLNA